VLKAQCIKNGKFMAIKCMKNHFESLDQVRLVWLMSGGAARAGTRAIKPSYRWLRLAR
jgi:hypothetical protein